MQDTEVEKENRETQRKTIEHDGMQDTFSTIFDFLRNYTRWDDTEQRASQVEAKFTRARSALC